MTTATLASPFFVRDSSWTLVHKRGESHLVLFATQNGLALAVLIYVQGHLESAQGTSHVLATIHFPDVSLDAAKEAAVDWAKKNIDVNVTLAQAT